MSYSEWARKKREREQQELGMRETASPSAERSDERWETSQETVREASNYSEWARKKRGVSTEKPVQGIRTTTTTNSITRDGNSYLNTARNASKTVIPASGTMNDDERKRRMAELEAEITATNDLLTRKQAGLARAVGINFQNGDVLQQDRDRLKALQEEYTALERAGEHTAAQELEWEREDAQRRVTEASKAMPEVTRNMAAEWRNNPELQSQYNQKAQEQMEAKRALELLLQKEELQEYVADVDEKSYEDTFGGQFGANRQLGRLNQDANEAMNRYIQNPTEENREAAYAMDALAKEFQQKYATVLDDEGAVLPWITQDAAGYLPQFWDQTKAQLGGAAVGALGGALVGNPVAGAKVGAVAATGMESYGQMRGAAYRTLLEAGVDEETAREAANDEALISSLIEMGGTAVSIMTLGGNKALDLLTDAAAKSGKQGVVKAITGAIGKKSLDKAAKTAAKEAGKSTLRKGVDLAGGILLHAGGEAVEEALQQGVSIANENRDDTGLLNLARETVGTLKDTFSKGNNETPEEINQKITALSDAYNNGEITYEEYERTYKELAEQFERASNKAEITEAAGGGFKIGLMFGGTNAVVNTVVSRVVNAKTAKQRNQIVDAVVEDREVLGALVEEGKASGENSVSAKIATEIEKTMADGKPVTRQQVEKLIASNEVYIQNENQQTAKSVARATRAADAQKLGYGEHGMAALEKLSERQEMAVEEVNAEFHLPYLRGLSNMDMKNAGIKTEAQREAFNAGRMDRIANLGKDAAKTAQVSSNAGFDYKSPHIPKTMSKATQDVYNDFSVALGTRTTVLEKIAAGGRESGANAIIMGDGSIGLSADTDIAKTPSYFFHEGLHRMKQLAPAETREFINAVVASTISDGATSSVEAMQNFAAERNVNLTVDSAMEEIAADRAGEMFGGDVNRAAAILRDVMGEIETEAKKNGKTETEAKTHARNVVQKFIDAIRSVIQSLKDYLSKNKGRMSEESRSEFEAAISDLTAEEQLWKDALKAAVKSAREKVETGSQQEYTGGNETKYSTKYWRPDLTKAEWSLLNYRMNKEIGDPAFDIDEATKWVFAKEKGTYVFAIYGVGDGTVPTPLYASGGKRAQADNVKWQNFLEGYDNGTNADRTTFDNWLKGLRSEKGYGGSNLYDAARRVPNVGDDGVHGRTQGRNSGRTAGTGKNNRGKQYSLKDSEGATLTKAQQEFFKDSKVRDENGNLLVMYHGSHDAGFHVFDPDYSDDSTSLFFVDDNDVARSYSGTKEVYAAKTFRTADDLNTFFEEIGADEYSVEEHDGKFFLLDDGDEVAESDTASGIYEEFQDWTGIGHGGANYKVYLNLTNPFVVEADGADWNQLPGLDGAEYSNTRDHARYAKSHDYDGVVFKNLYDVGAFGNNGATEATVAIAFKSEQVKSTENKNPTADKDIRFSLKEEDVQTAINQSMTMRQAKDMVQRAFVLGGIKDWFEDEYRNGDEWLRGEGVDDVAMVIDNEWQLQVKYLDNIQGLMDEDFLTTDILDAYLAGTLTGKPTKSAKPQRLDVSAGINATDNRFYAPHQIENAKAAFETASQKVTNKNRDDVYKARADVIMFAHTRGAAEALGLTQSELNKKLSTWARYTARSRETSQRFNAGVADWNKWTGIENSNILTRSTVSNEDLDRLVGEITGDSDGFQRKYIMRTMLALDTHIDYTGLKFEFVGVPDPNKRSVNGWYSDSARKISVKYNAPNTVAHEMGHYLDYQWARDIGLHGALTESRQGTQAVSGEVKVWHDHFMDFISSLTDAADLHSSYTMDNKEVFARFVDKFVRWVNFTANGEQDRFTLDRNDKFTAQHYIEFVRLLQEKSLLDGKKHSEAQFSLKGQSDLLKENAKLKEVNETLREQFKTTKFAQTDKKSLDAFAKKLLQDYQSGADINETRDALNDLYTYMANGEDGNAPAWNEVQRRAYETAVSVLEGASTVNDDLYREYKHLRDRLRNYGMTISPEYDHDLMGYESINEFRKANFGRIKLVKNGTPVDVVYQDLASAYPEFFDDTEYTTQADQLTHIAEVLDSLQPYEVNPYSYNMRESATWLANDIIERFYELPQAKPTFADKAQQKLTKQVIKDAKKLERVRDQKNERIAKLIERNREKVNATQQRERAKRAEAVERVREHYEAKEARASDRRKASLWRKKIKTHVDTISRLLLKGNDNSHVPEEMRTVVGEFLSVIDLTTPRQQDATIRRLQDLQSLYRQIAENKTDIDIEVDPDLQANMDEVLAALRNGKDTVTVADLNNRELEALYRVLLAVERSIYLHNRRMAEGKTAEISDLAQRVMIENGTSKEYREHNKVAQWAADMVNMDMLNPQDYFIQLGDTMNDLFQSIRDGFDKKIRHLAESQQYMDELLDGADVKSMSDKKATAKAFKTGNGATIRLTPAQVMSLYLLQRQPDALDHIYKGGIKPAPVVAMDGKSRRPKVQRAYEVVKVTPDDVANILDSMTAEQKRIAEGIGKFFTDYTAKWGNEVSMELYGYKKFTVENYFPIVSDQNYLKDVFGETNDATLKNMGSTKARTKGASNPIIIEDVFDVFSRQADSMSSYNAFVIPLSDIQRVYNFKTVNGSVKQSIEKKFGVRATGYFKKLMTDINGGARWNGGAQWMNELISRYKQAKLGLNLRVIVQQPTAMLRAQAVIDTKYIAQALAHKSSVDLETIYKYAPVAQWKNWGFFSMDTGKQMKDVLMDNKQLSDYTMWLAGKADELTWKRLWVAAEMEIRDKQDDLTVGSEEYLQAVGKRFSEIIDRTQVVDSVLHRSQIMRNPDTLVKMSVSFMNEPFKAYNMVRTAVSQFRNNPTEATKKALWAAGVAYLTTLVVNHLITAMVDTYRGDEDDEEWLEKMFKKITGADEEEAEPKTAWERYWWHFADNAVNEPLSMFPVVKDVVSLAQGYDIKRMDMQGIGDFVNALKRGLSDKYTPLQKIVDIGGKLGDLFGVPVSSLKREVGALAKLGVGAAGNPMVEYTLDKMLYTVTGNKKRFLDILYEAYKQGDMDVYNQIAQDMIDDGITPSAIESGMKSRAKKDGVSVANMEGKVFMVGIEPKYEIEKEDEERFTIDNLTSAQYTRYAESHGRLLEEITNEFQRRGFGTLDEETANALLSAAYTYAEETALEGASGGQYESDTKWVDNAQNADDLGMTPAEYIWAKGTHDASITADGVYKAYEAGVDVEDYLTFRDLVNDLEPGVDYEKGDTASRQAAIKMILMEIPGLTQDEYDYLYGTEYKAKSGFGGGFGGSFGGSFGGKFGK